MREWVLERLQRENIDTKIARASEIDATERANRADPARGAATGIYLGWLDVEDGGYHWGSEGPPSVR